MLLACWHNEEPTLSLTVYSSYYAHELFCIVTRAKKFNINIIASGIIIWTNALPIIMMMSTVSCILRT